MASAAPAQVNSSNASQETRTGRRSAIATVLSRDHLFADVDPPRATWPMAAFCFMTGFITVVGFSSIFIWVGFQTGNSAQLFLALARLFHNPPGPAGRDTTFHLADQQALTSLTTFLGGAFLGRIGDRMGSNTRAWLFFGTLLQALFTMAAALCVWQSQEGDYASDRGDPSWQNALSFACIGFMSASLGLQGIMGKRVPTQFATTIVLTTVWCELMADPQLFNFRKLVRSRDHKVLGVSALFLGAFVGRAILQETDAATALGIGAGFRALIALSWLAVPAKVKPQSKAAEAGVARV